VTVLCSKLGVTPGGYYAWIKRKKCQRDLDNEALLIEIRRAHAQGRETYGYPRVHRALRQQGIICGKHRVARIMRENGIVGKKATRYKKQTNRYQLIQNTNNLLLNREPVSSKNEVWVGDITFVRVKNN